MSKTTLTTQNYNHWYTRIYAYFYRRLDSVTDVRDLTCDTLSDFFTYPKKIQSEQTLIFTIAKNKLNSFIRSKYKQPFINELEDPKIDQNKLSYSSIYKEKTSALIECSKRHLKPNHFEVLEMSVLCDFTSKRVADELGITSDNVRQILSRSIKKIREKCRQIWTQQN